MSKNEKIAKIIKKYAKICDVKILQGMPFNLEVIQWTFLKPYRRFVGSWGWKNLKNAKNFQKKTWN